MATPLTYPVPRLLVLRVERAYSQEYLASLSGVGRATIARIELGRPARLGTIRKLAAALGVEPAVLLAQE